MVSTRPVAALIAEINELLGRVLLPLGLCREVRGEFIDRTVREVPVADVTSERVRLRADIVRVAGDNWVLRICCTAGETAGWSPGSLNGYALRLSDPAGTEVRHAVFSNGVAGFTVLQTGDLIGRLSLEMIPRQPFRREREEKTPRVAPWERLPRRSRRSSGRTFPARMGIRGHNH